jgi:SAM-dependent methyltransferase
LKILERFVKKGRQRFGKLFDEMMSLIVARGDGIKLDPYDLKNSSLDLSLYIGEQYTSNTWRAFATWLLQENFEPPSRVLDLGCENGVLTCFLASMWPAAQIVGVDHSGPAIMAAKSLATRLNLKNVSFEQMDASQLLQAHPGQFSVIIATMVMHEFLKGPKSREPFQWDEEFERLEDIRLSQSDKHAVSVLKIVEKALTDTGYLITLNRSPTSTTTSWFTYSTNSAPVDVLCDGLKHDLLFAKGPKKKVGHVFLEIYRHGR